MLGGVVGQETREGSLVGKVSSDSDLLAFLVAIVSQMSAPPLLLEGVCGWAGGRALGYHIPTKCSWIFLYIIPLPPLGYI